MMRSSDVLITRTIVVIVLKRNIPLIVIRMIRILSCTIV
jgi:hypothetical protein